MAIASGGKAMASASNPPVATSSPVETTALLNGSGLTLTTARVVALAPWLSSAPPPPSRKAVTCHAGSELSTSARRSEEGRGGKGVSVRLVHGGRRILKKKK